MPADDPQRPPTRLHGWRHPSIVAAAALSTAAGFAQFSATAALADVAAAFGEVTDAATVAGQLGLSMTTVGLGQAIIRASSLGSLPLSGAADRLGRRRVLLGCSAVGLALVAAAALSPGYWWFIALFALARAPLSTTNAIAGVVAAEETRTKDRARAIALITAGYGLGAGLTAIVRAVGGDAMGFRALFALALVPLALLPLIARLLEEPERFVRTHERVKPSRLTLAPLDPTLRGRFAVVALATFAITFMTGPVNTNLFIFAEGVLDLPRSATAIAVFAAGPLGLAGLLAGRWAADRFGRRGTAVSAHAAIALAGALTYSGSEWALLAGYLLSIGFGGCYAPAAGAISTELFPTHVRGTIVGWLTVAGVLGATLGLFTFGALVDLLGGFRGAGVAVSVPVLLCATLYLRLPETRGRELEESAPDPPTPRAR